MKKRILIKEIFSFALFTLIIFLSSCSSNKDNRYYYTTHTGKCITTLGNYIIFEKYDGNLPPETNYIYINNWYKDAEVCFKSGDSIVIFTRAKPEIFDFNFDTSKYHIDIYGNSIKDLRAFYQRSSFADSTVKAIYSFKTNRHCLEPSFFEVLGDSVYIKTYNVSSDFIFVKYNIKNSVFSRFTKRYNEQHILQIDK